jgi:DNA-binding NarL/FixJ family response regulator
VRVVLVDDHAAFRESFRIALSVQGGCEVVAEAADAAEGRLALERHSPDVAIVDLLLPTVDGISLIRDLKRAGAPTPVLVLTMSDGALSLRDAFSAGAGGYALKEQPLTEVIEAVRTVARGERYISPRLSTLLLGDAPLEGLDALSRREREIFRCVVQGLSNREIAKALFISVKTVQTHRSHINRKLDAHSTADLVRLAARHGLIIGGAEAE